MASTRLPGKVLERLRGDTVLAHVLRRCAAIDGVDMVCCAIPDDADCDAVAEEAERCGALVFRGSERDVLDRYHRAAMACGADVVMRVTSDCPLIDPGVCASLLRLFKDEAVDYACNNAPRGWPHGLDCEVFSAAALARAAAEASTPDEREHVTPWLRTHPDIARVNLAGPGGDLTTMRWTLDYPEDLAFLRALCARLPAPPKIPEYEEIVMQLRANPDIAAINAGQHQPGGTAFTAVDGVLS
jgi:spore coat polysaccharide biosynthesis protein SpsF (cytidylyltransferase family)